MSQRAVPARRRASRIEDMMIPASRVRSISSEKPAGGGIGSGVAGGGWGEEEEEEVGDVIMVIMVFRVLLVLVGVVVTSGGLVVVDDSVFLVWVSVDGAEEAVEDAPRVVGGTTTPTVIVTVTVTPAKVVRASSVTTRVFRMTGGVKIVVWSVVVTVDVTVRSGSFTTINSDSRGKGVTVTVTKVVLVGLMMVMVEVVVEKSTMPTSGDPLTTVMADVSVTVVRVVDVARAATALGGWWVNS